MSVAATATAANRASRLEKAPLEILKLRHISESETKLTLKYVS